MTSVLVPLPRCYICSHPSELPRLAILLTNVVNKVVFCSYRCLYYYQDFWIKNVIKDTDSDRVKAMKNAHKKRTECWLLGDVVVEEPQIENFLPMMRE